MDTIELHPEFLSKNGEKEFAVIPFSEFVALRKWIADMEDLLELETAIRIEGDASSIPLEDVERRFGITLPS